MWGRLDPATGRRVTWRGLIREKKMTIRIEKTGKRIFLLGDTFAFRNEIKALGGHWDGGRKAWWVGAAKAAKAEALAAQLSSRATERKGVDADSTIIGKATYKGRSYYVLWVGECKTGDYKTHLTVLDGSIDFWAACARPNEHAFEGVARMDKFYGDPKKLGSLQRFVNEKRREEVAKTQTAKVKTVAAGEATRQIPKVRDERIIKAFFGRATAYDYEVTSDDFDRDDNEGPGHYYGVTVPASLADRWDAGILACKKADIKEMRSREALTIRYRLMVADETAALPAELESVLSEADAKQAVKDEARRKVVEQKAAVAALLDGLVQSSVGPTAPQTVAVYLDAEKIEHHMASNNPGDCTFDAGETLSYDGSRYFIGRTADGQRIIRQDFRGYDDYRTYYYAPVAVAKAWALAYATVSGITVEAAREWLSKYSDCHGNDLYQSIVDAAK